MDVLMLSRLQFAAATFFHFLFVPLTLGLSIMVAIMETIYVRTGDEEYKRMAKFWGKIFLINFAIGVVTGITLEFQFGTNWSRYSAYVGDIFGSLLAIEATLAFFLESTFIAVWIFGWDKLSPKVHNLAIWLVAAAANISAYWIITANAWMQHPVGYVLRNGRAELDNLIAIITQRFAVVEFMHTVAGAYILSAFFVMGICAYHLLRKKHVSFFTKSFRIAIAFALIFSIFEVFQGHLNGSEVAATQPAKLAAMESHWDTKKGADLYLFAIPDPENEGNSVQFGRIPSGLSMLAYHDADSTVKGLKDFPVEDRPPVMITFLSFKIMVVLGFLLMFVAIWAWLRRNKLTESRNLLYVLMGCIPLPYIASEAGWTVAEVGRQPWIVYNLMRTADAVSPIAFSQVMTSFLGFIVVYSLLGIAAFYLMFKYAGKGPEGLAEGGEEVSHA